MSGDRRPSTTRAQLMTSNKTASHPPQRRCKQHPPSGEVNSRRQPIGPARPQSRRIWLRDLGQSVSRPAWSCSP